MQLEILNTEILSQVDPTFDISIEDIRDGYYKLFEKYPLGNINIVFVKGEYIRDLNRKFRNIDASTDVLSFKISEGSNDADIYICPEYSFDLLDGDQFEEEILRLIVHGTLHILGYDHSGTLEESSEEEMFLLQEDLLFKYRKICSL